MNHLQNRDITPCASCGGRIGKGQVGPLVGARVAIKLERLVVNTGRLNAHLGLEQHFAEGGEQAARALADVKGPGTVIDAPEELVEELEVLVCNECLLPLMAITESLRTEEAKR